MRTLQVRAAELLPHPSLKRGEPVRLVGLTKHLRVMQRTSTVTNATAALTIPSAEVRFFSPGIPYHPADATTPWALLQSPCTHSAKPSTLPSATAWPKAFTRAVRPRCLASARCMRR